MSKINQICENCQINVEMMMFFKNKNKKHIGFFLEMLHILNTLLQINIIYSHTYK